MLRRVTQQVFITIEPLCSQTHTSKLPPTPPPWSTDTFPSQLQSLSSITFMQSDVSVCRELRTQRVLLSVDARWTRGSITLFSLCFPSGRWRSQLSSSCPQSGGDGDQRVQSGTSAALQWIQEGVQPEALHLFSWLYWWAGVVLQTQKPYVLLRASRLY